MRTRFFAAIGALLMGAGLIGLPSLPDDLARWPPLIAGSLTLAADVVAPLGSLAGRWLMFGVGVVIFWRTLHASVSSPVAPVAPRGRATDRRVGVGERGAKVATGSPAPEPAPDRNQSEQSSRPIMPVGPQPPERRFVSATPEYLVGLFASHTSMEANRLLTDFIGGWVVVEGTVRDVTDISDIRFVQITSTGGTLTGLSFYEAWRDRVATLRKGSPIRAVGRINSVNGMRLDLDPAELPENDALSFF
jgi:hypothetical protein